MTIPSGGRLGGGWFGRWRFFDGAVGCLLLVFGMGAFMVIMTTEGQLVIETASPDVEVRILKAGEPYRELTLEQRAKTLRLGGGEYKIEIVSDSDGLVIENGQYTLRRGEVWLARIVHHASRSNDLTAPVVPAPATASCNAPTYESKTLAQWLQLLRWEGSAQQVLRSLPGAAWTGHGGRRQRGGLAVG